MTVTIVYTGGCIKHKTNGLLQACNILRLHCVLNSATGALPGRCMWLLVPVVVGSCGCIVSVVAGCI